MKTTKFKGSLIAVLFCLGCVSLSHAQQRNNERKSPPTYAELLKEMDTNEDGKLAKAEVKGPLKEKFTEIDTDEDGFISEEEFKKAPKPERRRKD